LFVPSEDLLESPTSVELFSEFLREYSSSRAPPFTSLLLDVVATVKNEELFYLYPLSSSSPRLTNRFDNLSLISITSGSSVEIVANFLILILAIGGVP
jgi:hypothetical protein